MNGRLIAFIIWAVIGCFLIGLGVFAFFAKKPVGFWANVETMKVNDTKGYNRATGKLFIAYGLVFILLGLPLLGQSNAYVLLSILGVMLETIVIMAIYTVSITKKYGAK